MYPKPFQFRIKAPAKAVHLISPFYQFPADNTTQKASATGYQNFFL
jgi:hypothetical protein